MAAAHAVFTKNERIKMVFIHLLRSLILTTIAVTTVAFVRIPSGKIIFLSPSTPLLRHFTQVNRNVDKEIYRPSKVEGNYDVVVIGSGIGGLTAASLMAQAGKKVLVLEQHYVAGGACHTFKRKGFEFATGIHYVGDLEEQDKGGYKLVFKHLIDTVTPAKNPLDWDRMDDCYDSVIIGNQSSRYNVVAGEKDLKKELIKQFPDEEKAIRKYFKVVKRTVAAVEKVALLKALPLSLSRFLLWTRLHRLVARGYTKVANAPLENVLEQLTSNKNLQAVLAYNYANYGTEPKRAPFLMQALVASHFMNGAYYPRGGPSDIPKKVIQTILDNEGKVLVSAPVAQILVDEHTGKAKGVQMKDGRVIESSIVVSDAGFINTITKLLPEGLVNIDFAAENSPNQLHPGSSGLTLFVGLKGNAEALNLPKSNIFIHSSNDLSGTAERIEKLSLEKAMDMDPKDFGVIFVGCPSTKDSNWSARHPDKSTLEIITQAPYHWFESFERTFDKTTKSHGPEYEYVKTRLAEKVWSRVVDVLDGAKLPKTLDAVDHYEVGSPLSYAHYYNAQRGALYGLDLDLKRFEPKTFLLRLRPEIPEVPGLYLTGQDIAVDGMIGAMFGGLLCAQKVLGLRKVMSLLRKSRHKKEQQPIAKAT